MTGASAGIGRELARLFAADGCNLVVVARRAAALDDLVRELTAAHRISARALAADLSQPGAGRTIADALAATPVDVVVNNAGFGAQGPVAEIPVERQLEMIQVNVTALTELTRLLLPGMLARNRGGVLNVGSTAGFQPGPNMAVYYATKAYVISFTDALAEEVAGTALHVTCLAPGPTATEFADVAGVRKSRLFQRAVMTAADVARAGYDGWKQNKTIVVPGFSNWIGTLFVRVSPRSMVRQMTKRLNS
ncbi:MAG TPA: SDR family oxidoreductase [Vicinamibacterales bacterium]